MNPSRIDRKLIWSLGDLRRWLASSARYRWTRVLRLAPSRDLTNFGDLL